MKVIGLLRSWFTIGLLVAAIAGIVACAGPGRRGASDVEQSQYDEAVKVSRRDPARGATLLAEFLTANPRSALADDAANELAELALRGGDEERAKDWLYLIVREYPNDETADRARLLLAGIEARSVDLDSGSAASNDAARRLLSRIRFARLSLGDRRTAYRLLADLSDDAVDRLSWRVRERGAVLEALEESGYESQMLGGGLEDLEREIAASLDSMTDRELERAVRVLSAETSAARALLLLTRRALQAGDFKLASEYFSRTEDIGLARDDQPLYEEVALALELRERIVDTGDAIPSFAEVLLGPMPNTEGVTGVIGVVLPLTGRFAKYGEESLRGVLMAAGIFDPLPDPDAEPSDESAGDDLAGDGGIPAPLLAGDGWLEEEGAEEVAPGLRIVIRDSGGTPEGAAKAVESLAADPELVAIVGPLMGNSAEAAAGVADELGIPMLALTAREEVPRNRSYVFRIRTSPRDEIRTLVNYATSELGATRYAILYPKDNYGRGMRDHFWEAVERKDGLIVASSGYEPGATDFATPIREMIGYSLLTGEEKAALEQRDSLLRRARRLDPTDGRLVRNIAYSIQGPAGEPLPPKVDYDVLFIPDSHDKIVLIAPQLTFHETGGVNLMGPGGWNHPDLVQIGRKHVRGAVISALFHEESRFPYVSEFVADYDSTFGSAPDVFSAHGYDATRLVMVQLKEGALSRESVRNGILRTQGFPGVSGVISMTPDGNARKRPFLLKVRGGRMVSLD